MANFFSNGKIRVAYFAAISVIAALLHPAAKAQNPADIPVEVFAALPDVAGAQLSPSGQQLAYISGTSGRNNLIVQNLDGSSRIAIPPSLEEMDFDDFFWKTDELVVLTLSANTHRRMFRAKTSEQRTLSINLKTSAIKWLGSPKKRSSSLGTVTRTPSAFEHIIDPLINDPEHILLSLQYIFQDNPQVYKVNVISGHQAPYQNPMKGILSWYTDQQGKVRLGTGYHGVSYFYGDYKTIFKSSSGDWIDVRDTDWGDRYRIEGFDKDPNIAFVTDLNEQHGSSMWRLNLDTGKIIDVVFDRENRNVWRFLSDDKTGIISGLSYIDDFPKPQYFDTHLALVQRSLEKALPGTNVTIVSEARDVERYLVRTETDKNPGEYFLFDREKGSLAWLMSARTKIDESQMFSTEAVEIPTRDGTIIAGYLTRPNGHNTEPLPTVILPHAEPAARDGAAWKYKAQFFASRGYLVLKPNFRGSDGYGDSFRKKGNLQWGGLMQDDITDATRWVIDQGFADPNRICIVGSSFGGHAALMGTIKEPGLYKCVVSINGYVDLPKLKRVNKNFDRGRYGEKMIGLEGQDLKAISPRQRAADISAPVLLISSKDTARIPYKHARALHRKLRQLGKQSRYIKLEDGRHNLVTPAARLTMLAETEKFLTKYIGEQSGAASQ